MYTTACKFVYGSEDGPRHYRQVRTPLTGRPIRAGFSLSQRSPLRARLPPVDSPKPPRPIDSVYLDPLDVLWLGVTRQLGITVNRSHEVFAHWDGKDTLFITEPEHMDPDDCLGQMLFHEICHALVGGKAMYQKVDWGLENVDLRDLVYEQATNRLQAALTDCHGLRRFFGTTTEVRDYYDALPLDPLLQGDDPAISLARAAYDRAREGPWANAIESGLRRTRALADAITDLSPPNSLWRKLDTVHATGFIQTNDDSLHCRDCAWFYQTASGRGRCRRTVQSEHRKAQKTTSRALGCVYWETKLSDDSCGSCGACCRAAFDMVQVRAKDIVVKKHPELVHDRSGFRHIPRPNGRCLALSGDGTEGTPANGTGDSAGPYRCRIYADRPRSCGDFAVAGEACLQARRRVRVSP